MIAGKIFTWFLLLSFVMLILFVALLLLPGIIELIAEAIDDLKWATDKLKDVLRKR